MGCSSSNFAKPNHSDITLEERQISAAERQLFFTNKKVEDLLSLIESINFPLDLPNFPSLCTLFKVHQTSPSGAFLQNLLQSRRLTPRVLRHLSILLSEVRSISKFSLIFSLDKKGFLNTIRDILQLSLEVIPEHLEHIEKPALAYVESLKPFRDEYLNELTRLPYEEIKGKVEQMEISSKEMRYRMYVEWKRVNYIRLSEVKHEKYEGSLGLAEEESRGNSGEVGVRIEEREGAGLRESDDRVVENNEDRIEEIGERNEENEENQEDRIEEIGERNEENEENHEDRIEEIGERNEESEERIEGSAAEIKERDAEVLENEENVEENVVDRRHEPEVKDIEDDLRENKEKLNENEITEGIPKENISEAENQVNNLSHTQEIPDPLLTPNEETSSLPLSYTPTHSFTESTEINLSQDPEKPEETPPTQEIPKEPSEPKPEEKKEAEEIKLESQDTVPNSIINDPEIKSKLPVRRSSGLAAKLKATQAFIRSSTLGKTESALDNIISPKNVNFAGSKLASEEHSIPLDSSLSESAVLRSSIRSHEENDTNLKNNSKMSYLKSKK